MLLSLAEARLRNIELPDDDDAAQAIIDEQTAWLARRIGPLEGERTETFYVAMGRTCGVLYLARHTDDVTVVDGGSTLAADQVRLEANGSAVRRETAYYPINWVGPYVAVTYTPNDEDEVRRVIADLCSLASREGPYASEAIGAYSYNRGSATLAAQTRAALADGIRPRRPPALTVPT